MTHRLSVGAAAFRIAIILVGGMASLGLLGWTGWWALTTPLTAPHFPLPGVTALCLVLAWGLGCLTVRRRPWLSCGCFLAAGALIVSAWAVAPQPALLIAISLGLAGWTLLSRASAAVEAGRPEETPAPARPPCQLCQWDAATTEGFCGTCAIWVRTHGELWAGAPSAPPGSQTAVRPRPSPAEAPVTPAAGDVAVAARGRPLLGSAVVDSH